MTANHSRGLITDSAVGIAIAGALAYVIGRTYVRAYRVGLGIPANAGYSPDEYMMESIDVVFLPATVFFLVWMFLLRSAREKGSKPKSPILLVNVILAVWMGIQTIAAWHSESNHAVSVTMLLMAGLGALLSLVLLLTSHESRHTDPSATNAYYSLFGFILLLAAAAMMGRADSAGLLMGCGTAQEITIQEAELPQLANRTFLVLAQQGGNSYLADSNGSHEIVVVRDDLIELASVSRADGRFCFP